MGTYMHIMYTYTYFSWFCEKAKYNLVWCFLLIFVPAPNQSIIIIFLYSGLFHSAARATTFEKISKNVDFSIAKGCNCNSSQHNCCGWRHTSNALWKELENSPFNKRKNHEVFVALVNAQSGLLKIPWKHIKFMNLCGFTEFLWKKGKICIFPWFLGHCVTCKLYMYILHL